MADRILFPCPTCKARLRASLRLVGRSLPCPGCGKNLVVPFRVPSEQPPLLVLEDLPRPRVRSR